MPAGKGPRVRQQTRAQDASCYSLYTRGWTAAEIGEHLGMPVQTVYDSVKRGRERHFLDIDGLHAQDILSDSIRDTRELLKRAHADIENGGGAAAVKAALAVRSRLDELQGLSPAKRVDVTTDGQRLEISEGAMAAAVAALAELPGRE